MGNTALNGPTEQIGNYTVETKSVGKGGYGAIHRARGAKGSIYALKIFFTGMEKFAEKEAANLKVAAGLVSKNKNKVCITSYVDIFTSSDDRRCIVTEPFCNGGDLEHLIFNNGVYTLQEAFAWVVEVAHTLHFLHTTAGVKLVHGDFSARNVLLHKNKGAARRVAYVVDLGLSWDNNPYGRVAPYDLERIGASRLPAVVSETLLRSTTALEEGRQKKEEIVDATLDSWSWGRVVEMLLVKSTALWGQRPEDQKEYLASFAWASQLEEKWAGDKDVGLLGGVVDVLRGCLRKTHRHSIGGAVWRLRKVMGLEQPEHLEERLELWRTEDELDRALERKAEPDHTSEQSEQSVLFGLATVLMKKANLHQGFEEHLQAKVCLEEALVLRRKALPEGHPDIATSLSNLAAVHHSMGNHGEALKLFQEALVLERKTLPEGHPDIALYLTHLAEVHRSMGNHGEALKIHQALALRRKALPEGDPDIAKSLNNFALVHRAMGNHGEALKLCQEALVLQRKALPEGHPDIAASLNNLASVHHAMGNHGEALKLHQEALVLWRKALPEGHPHIAASLNNLASVHDTMGNHGEALKLHREALVLRRKALPEGHPDTAREAQGE